MSSPSPLRLILLPAALGAAVAVALLPVPPLHRLTHELTQLFTALMGLAWLPAAAAITRRAPSPAAGLWRSLLGSLSLGAGALSVHLVTDGLLASCHTAEAAAFFVITWVPAAVLASACGAMAAPQTVSLRGSLILLALGAGIFGLGVAHDVVQGLRGLRVVDPFLGAALCMDQRAPMDLDALMLLQRGWLLLLAATVWVVARWRRTHAPLLRLPTRLLTGATVATTVLGGSHLGLGWGDGAIRRELDATATSAHFVALYGSDGVAALFVPRPLAEA